MTNNQTTDKPEIIPVASPRAENYPLMEQINNAFHRVFKSGSYILGNEVRLFEKEFADYLGVKYAIGVGNGTDAVTIALSAAGVSSGDEVITVSHSAVATVAAIERSGATPVFVDIDSKTRCMDSSLITSRITEKTKAILPVHIYGQPAPMNEINLIAEQFNLVVVEDCAQAHGAEIQGRKVGSFGAAGAFSFYPTKNLGGMGDGGALVTNSKEVAEKAIMLRQYGWKEKFVSDFSGINSRLDELQAAILREKLPFLDQNNNRRREIADRYRTAVDSEKIITPKYFKDTISAMHLFVVESENRDSLSEYLSQKGISSARHYPLPIHQQPAYMDTLGSGHLPETDKLYQRMLTIPLYPELNERQIDKICSALSSWS